MPEQCVARILTSDTARRALRPNRRKAVRVVGVGSPKAFGESVAERERKSLAGRFDSVFSCEILMVIITDNLSSANCV